MNNEDNNSDAEAPKETEAEAKGYGRPPKAFRFKPGTSGNLGGRPKKSHSRRSMVERVLLEKRRVDIDGSGRPCEMATLELVLLVLRRAACEGNHRAFKIYEAIDARFGEQEPTEKAGYLLVGKCESWDDWHRLFGAKDDPAGQDPKE